MFQVLSFSTPENFKLHLLKRSTKPMMKAQQSAGPLLLFVIVVVLGAD
jgi:hypothetical protein